MNTDCPKCGDRGWGGFPCPACGGEVDDDEHFPWHYTEFGVLCACGDAMDADENCMSKVRR